MKKRMGVAAALAAVLALGAAEAEEWGILSFMEQQGVTVAQDKLVTLPEQSAAESTLVEITVTEMLRDGDVLRLALVVKPRQVNTLVIPNYWVESEGWMLTDADEPGSMEVMDHADVDPGLSVREYAVNYDRVVSLSIPGCEADGEEASLEYAAFDHLEDGSLQMILQYSGLKEDAETWQISAVAEAFDESGLLKQVNCEMIEFAVNGSANR